MPLMVARYIARESLPPSNTSIALAVMIVILPTYLIYLEPDLGTSCTRRIFWLNRYFLIRDQETLPGHCFLSLYSISPSNLAYDQ